MSPSHAARRVRLVLAFVLALLMTLPFAAAKESLSALEEPHTGDNKLWDVTVSPEEAGEARALVFRNPVRVPFRFVVYDEGGAEIFTKNGSRGVQTLPAFDAADYRFFVSAGSFQVTNKTLARGTGDPNVTATLVGTHDAYILAANKPYTVSFSGNVEVEWFDMTTSPETFQAPGARASKAAGAYVVTVKGAEGATYSITLVQGAAPETDETPALPVAMLLGALVLVALGRRR